MAFCTFHAVLIFLMHSCAAHLFISLPPCSLDIHKRWVFGVKHPIRPLWMSKSPSRHSVLSVGQRILLRYWSPHRQGGQWIFHFYRVSSSTPRNNMPLRCPFILVWGVWGVRCVFMWDLRVNQNSSRHWSCNITVQYYTSAMQLAGLCLLEVTPLRLSLIYSIVWVIR